MKKDLASVIRKTASFLDKAVPEDRMADLVDHLSFNKNPGTPTIWK